MKLLRLRVRRYLKHHLLRFAALFLILAFMVAIQAGFFLSQRSVRTEYLLRMDEGRVETLHFDMAEPLSKETEEQIEQENDVRLVYAPYCEISEKLLYEKDPVLFRLYRRQEQMNQPLMLQGHRPEKPDEMAIDQSFARVHHLKPGDSFALAGHEFIISGIGVWPNYSFMIVRDTDPMYNHQTFVMGEVNAEGFDILTKDKALLIHEYVLRRNHEKPLLTETDFTARKLADEELAERIKSPLRKVGRMSNFILREENQAISFVREDMESDVPMMLAFGLILLLVLGFIFVMLGESTVLKEAPAIGTLLALGIRRRDIFLQYLIPGVLVTFLGSLAGLCAAAAGFAPFFSKLYSENYSLAPFRIHADPLVIVLSLLLPSLMIALIQGFSLWRRLSLKPLSFLRRDFARNKRTKQLRLTRGSFGLRYRMRLIMQNIGSYLTLSAGVFLCILLLLFAFCFKPSLNSYDRKMRSDVVSEYQYILKSPILFFNDKEAETFSITMLSVDTRFREKERVNLYGLQDHSKFFKDADVEALKSEAEEADGTPEHPWPVVMNEDFLLRSGHEVGDCFEMHEEARSQSFFFVVRGSISYSVGFNAFMPQAALNRMIGVPGFFYNGILSDHEIKVPAGLLMMRITRADIGKTGETMIKAMGSILDVMIVISLVLFGLVMLLLSHTVLERNSLSMAYLKVFGYDNRKIGNLYILSLFEWVVLSLVSGLFIVRPVLKLLYNIAGSKMTGYIPMILPVSSQIFTVICGIFTFGIVALFNYRTINRVSLAEALKVQD